ncbi:NAD(P)-binding domain-containing protein [Cognatishimia sp. F0-27]|uniref:NAD(P)-binding domain-containing protein n=1 Tax=Cognatishimia sp. F0-27 TaxID=2816855 RepID=UPI001D0CABA9|nr:NAD(P)-binding domain-containing protein [Cognatishimia sp. F0-27]MCC1492860.1 NAD(P)-binding domain-containing protein [Cognatishimia sp. F0-27]
MSAIGFIGTGHIAAPMARFLARKGHRVVVTKRNAAVSEALKAEIGAEITDAQGVLDCCETVFLCLRPHVADTVLGALTFSEEHKLVSVMAGVARDRLNGLCAPARQIVQTIPLGFLEQGGCPLAAFGDIDMLARLFEPENPIVAVADEAALNAHFAVCAMVPGLLDLMAGTAAWLETRTGDAAGATLFTTQMMAGFLAAMDKAPGALARERDALSTEGTLSLTMVETLRGLGADRAMIAGLDAVNRRLEPDP